MTSEGSGAESGRQLTGFELYDLDVAFGQMESWPTDNMEILDGHPEGHRGKVIYRDPTGQFSVGVWECPPSKFRVVGDEDECGIETCVMGKAKITDELTGKSHIVTPGMKWFVRPGTAELWQVLEPFRKEYVAFGPWEDGRYW